MLQRTYGKQADNLDKVSEMFVRVLKGYEPEKVILAIKDWLLKDFNFPTPADIVAILNPKPKLDYAFYNRLIEKSKNSYLSSKEWEYIKLYEEDAMKGL